MSWYADGLRFTCRRCGNCCSGRGSVVRVSLREIEALARYVGLAPREFVERHTTQVHGMTVLRDEAGTDACEWLDRAADGTTSCRVQPAKPDQCASYPFWPRIVASKGAWETEGATCRGIGQGELVRAQEVERRMGLDRAMEALETLLEDLDAELAALGAKCWARGGCCDFGRAGHRLYATRIEALRFLQGVELRAWDPGSDSCPAWKDGRCTAREHRPVGCRVYHCDPAYEELLQDVMERYTTRLKWIHERACLSWDYRDWVAHLCALKEGG